MPKTPTDEVIDKYAELLEQVYKGRRASKYLFERILGDFLRELAGVCTHPRFGNTDACIEETCPNHFRRP